MILMIIIIIVVVVVCLLFMTAAAVDVLWNHISFIFIYSYKAAGDNTQRFTIEHRNVLECADFITVVTKKAF